MRSRVESGSTNAGNWTRRRRFSSALLSIPRYQAPLGNASEAPEPLSGWSDNEIV